MRKHFLINILSADVRKMSAKQHAFYWIIPTVLLGILMVFYFSGVPTLVEIVSPEENWEWGLLENLQLLIILGIFVVSVYACLSKKAPFLKFGFCFTAFFALFVFMEEIDYGAHFAQLMGQEVDNPLREYIGGTNIHNQGNNAKIFKRSVYLLMALIFVIAPFLKSKIQNPYILYLIPKPRIVIVAVLTIVSDLVPRLIVELGILKDGGLGVNIGEFSEIMVYYIFLIYLLQLLSKNQFRSAQHLEKRTIDS